MDGRVELCTVHHPMTRAWLDAHGCPLTCAGVSGAMTALDNREPGVSGREGEFADIYMELDNVLWGALDPVMTEPDEPRPDL